MNKIILLFFLLVFTTLPVFSYEQSLLNDNELQINKNDSLNIPFELYSILNVYNNDKVLHRDTVKILNLIWNDSEGRILLSLLIDNNISINISSYQTQSNANITYQEKSSYIGFLGIPLLKYKTKKNKSIAVNISDNHIKGFFNSYLQEHERDYHFQVFLHEFCHAAKSLISSQQDNSMTEEISASIIGYNITYRILKHRGLTPEEVDRIAELGVKAVLRDEHRELPVYNSFNSDIQKIGISLPYLERYHDIAYVYARIKNDSGTMKLDRLDKIVLTKSY